MKYIILSHLSGVALGVAVTFIAIWVSEPSIGQLEKIYPSAQLVEVEHISESLRNLKPARARVRGRVWSGGQGFMQNAGESLEKWHDAGIGPTMSGLPEISFSDNSFVTLERWIKGSNGAFCEIIGHLKPATSARTAEVATMDIVERIRVIDGIAATFDDLKLRPDKYHGVVIKISGIVGSQPRTANRGLYQDDEGWRNRDAERAILIEPNFSLSGNGNFDCLSVPGNKVSIDALYHRPFKDDGFAPIGRLILIHVAKPQ